MEKNFDFQFSIFLHVLRNRDYKMSVSLWLYLSVCAWHKICGRSVSRTNSRNFIKVYIQLLLDIKWCWLVFGAIRSTDDAVKQPFNDFRNSSTTKTNVRMFLKIQLIRKMKWHFLHFGENRSTDGTVCTIYICTRMLYCICVRMLYVTICTRMLYLFCFPQ